MAIDQDRRLKKARKQSFGIGLLKGMAVTIKHLFSHNVVIEYPDEKQDLSARTRGVIALKEENCTVCMLCARECPDWCIYIDSHKETLPPKREGGRQRKRNVLDRFAIDYALCMYCGICVEVCPYDALFWSREFEYSEYDIRQLTHEKERLSDWMASVLPPPPLEEGAEIPGGVAKPAAAAAPAPAPSAQERPMQPVTSQATSAETVAATGSSPSTVTSSAAEARPQQAATAPKEGSFTTMPERPADTIPATERATETDVARVEPGPAPGLEEDVKQETNVETATTEGTTDIPAATGATESAAPPAEVTPAPTEVTPAPTEVPAGPPAEANVPVPHEERRPTPLEQTEDPEEVHRQVLEEQLAKGSSPQVAEARAKVARVKAERGIRRAAGAVPPQPESLPEAPSAGRPTEPTPSGAPEGREIEPDPGPVAPAPEAQAEVTVPSDREALQDRIAEEAAIEEDAKRAAEGAATPDTGAADTLEQQEVAPAPEAPAPKVAEQEQQFEAERSDAAPEAEPSEQAAVQATGESVGDADVPSPTAQPSAAAGGEDPEAVYERVIAEEREKGSAEAVAVARAKAARARAQRDRRRG